MGKSDLDVFDTADGDAGQEAGAAKATGRRARPRRRVSVVGVVGELLITAGVFVFLFIGWQVWLNDLILHEEQKDDALALSQEFGADVAPTPSPDASEPAVGPVDYGDPVISPAVAEKDKFANIYVPRFGADYVVTIAQGISTANVLKTGVGHYPDTQMPGEVGNFALAAHRTTYGAPFKDIDQLRVGDKIYIQTADGWYTYVFRTLQYVKPTGVDVLEEVPQAPDVAPTDRVMTMTSCSPKLSSAERIIAYSVFDSWQPISAGAPAEVAALATAGA